MFHQDPLITTNNRYLFRYQENGDNMAFQGGYDRGPREMHKAVCSDCKKECEVPFKPRGDRPIYCKDCYSKRKDSGR